MISVYVKIQDIKYRNVEKYKNLTTKNRNALAVGEHYFINACYMFVSYKMPAIGPYFHQRIMFYEK